LYLFSLEKSAALIASTKGITIFLKDFWGLLMKSKTDEP
jgi:hypothetical protein